MNDKGLDFKHKEVIENAVKKGNLSIDSLNKQFQKIKST